MRTSRLPLDDCPQISMMGIGHHAGGSGGTYVFDDLWCLHLYRYHGTLVVDGETYVIAPGTCSVVPPQAHMAYTFGDARCVHAFALMRLGTGTRYHGEVPLMLPLGTQFSAFYHALESAVRFRATQQRRAEARVYDLLFHLVAVAAPAAGGYSHPVLPAVLEWIDLHLAEDCRIARICQEFQLSHNHLNRLFQQDLQCTIGAYIQQRRLAWATHLLTETQVPIKVIASDLGCADLAQFSHLIRRHTGRSPRCLRAEGGGEAAVV